MALSRCWMKGSNLRAIVASMNVGSSADVIIILNLIVFMFEERGFLMWSKLVQLNALRALFMAPTEANLLAEKAQAVTAANSAYRNLLYIVNRDSKQLIKDRAAAAGADTLSAEYHTLQRAIAVHNENHAVLTERRRSLDDEKRESRTTYVSVALPPSCFAAP